MNVLDNLVLYHPKSVLFVLDLPYAEQLEW